MFPEFQFGVFNGWLPLLIFVIIEGLLLLSSSKEGLTRLFDRKGWTRWQRTAILIQKSSTLVNLILIIITPLTFGSINFIVGVILFSFGEIIFTVATLNFKNAPSGKPITKGLYKYSRNPVMVSIYIVFSGICAMMGSWISLILLGITITFSHFALLGEERRLLEQYGDSYEKYKKSVPRYFLIF